MTLAPSRAHGLLHIRRLLPVAAAALLAFDAGSAAAADASNEALLRLLQVLRDRGSISAQEYDDIRGLAEAPAARPAVSPPAPDIALREAAQDTAIAEVKAATTGTPAPVVSRALAGKWYERLSLRGYTQFRGSEVTSESGAVLEVPADRSVNRNESFSLRRGRVVLSGDVAEHLSLYAQTDFNGSTGTGDFALQMRDLYGDIWLDKSKTLPRAPRAVEGALRLGQPSVEPESGAAGASRRDQQRRRGRTRFGSDVMWASTTARQRFRDLVAQGLKGSGDYGVAAVGLYSGQGLNRPDQNGDPHVLARVSYPFKTAGGRFMEFGVQGYHGHFVVPTQAITSDGVTFTPTQPDDGVLDTRLALTAIVYPQPIGVEAEWNFGEGPELSADLRSIESRSLQGGYVQLNYRTRHASGCGSRSHGGTTTTAPASSPAMRRTATSTNWTSGVEFARWAELEITGVYTHTFRRTRTSTFPFEPTRDANRLGFQVQWNY